MKHKDGVRKNNKFNKILIILVSLLVISTFTLNSSIMYIVDSMGPVTNRFEYKQLVYKVKLNANMPAGYDSSEADIPEVVGGNEQLVAWTETEFILDGSPKFPDNTYKFAGWYTDSGDRLLTSNEKTIHISYDSEYVEIQGNEVILHLNAKWIPNNQYMITYDANSNMASFEDGKTEYTEYKYENTSYELSQIKPIREGFIWTEWNTEPDGSGERWLGGGTYNDNTDLTLYAIWSPKTTAVIGTPNFVNMEDTSVTWNNDYSFDVQCKTRGGADGIAIPITGLIEGERYRLTYSVSFNDFSFYDEDGHSYIFGCNIIDAYKNYDIQYSILSQNGATKTHRYENMQWSTEDSGHYEVSLDFVPNSETMYWFWETTDIVDFNLMKYEFNNFNIQILEEADAPRYRIAFEDATVKFNTAPYIARAIGNNTATSAGAPINTSTTNYGTRWTDYVNNSGQELTARHKNYFHTEYYGFDNFQYRLWGYDGHENMTIPIEGSTPGNEYTIYFDQDVSGTNFYGSLSYGFVVNNESSMPTSTGQSGSIDNQSDYMDCTSRKLGVKSKSNSYTFTATDDTMYMHWTLGDMKDGSVNNWRYNTVKLTNIEIVEN